MIPLYHLIAYCTGGVLFPLMCIRPRFFEIHFSFMSSLLSILYRNYVSDIIRIWDPVSVVVLDSVMIGFLAVGIIRALEISFKPCVRCLNPLLATIFWIWSFWTAVIFLSLPFIGIAAIAFPYPDVGDFSFGYAVGRLTLLGFVILWVCSGFYFTISEPEKELIWLKLPESSEKKCMKSIFRTHHKRTKLTAGKQKENFLSVFQLTDVHIHPLTYPLPRLRRLCEWVASQMRKDAIDIVVFTGDFMTHDIDLHSEDEFNAVVNALSPLLSFKGRLFACLGNHDMENERVQSFCISTLESAGFEWLRDDGRAVNIPANKWHDDFKLWLVGVDFKYPWKRKTIGPIVDKAVTELAASQDSPPRAKLLLLHDPSGISSLTNSGFFILSGHYHGGQIGLTGFGIPWTVLKWIPHMYSFGQFHVHGKNACYVHAGTGYYGMPLRIGVPGEESIIQIPLL